MHEMGAILTGVPEELGETFAMQQKTFEAQELQITTVFGRGFLFEIPPYQRPYAWTTEEADELLRDTMVAMDNNEEAYFLGSVVLIRDSESSVCQIIDGQQRLATLTILFCVLRELSSDSRVARSLDQHVKVEGDILAGIEDGYRLTLRNRDKVFFQDNVQDSGKLEDFIHREVEHPLERESQQRIFENAKSLWENLEQQSVERRNALSTYITQKCYLVVVTASDTTSAHRIFSVLNARGMNLDATDILKAEILGYVPEDREVEYTRKWEDLEDELGRDEFGSLFAHLYVIYNKNRHHRELSEAFRMDVLEKNEVGGMPFVDNVLEPYADAYQAVSKAIYESADNANDVNLYLQYLSWIDNTDWIPPVMAFYHQHRSDSDAMLRFLKDFDRLAYGLFILRFRRDPRVNRYAKVLDAIETGSELSAVAGGPLALTAQEKRDILRTLDGRIYQKQTWRFTTPLLARLSNAMADTPISDFEKATVEHVLPQNPPQDSEWLEIFSDDDERGDWTHRLANLVLLSHKKNARAQNHDFTRKKTEYFSRYGIPSFALTTQVIEKLEWTPSVLQRRQEFLLDVLKEEWRLG